MQARRRCPLARPGNAFAEEERAGPRHRLGTRWAGLSETAVIACGAEPEPDRNHYGDHSW
jgi:hypothetical protein